MPKTIKLFHFTLSSGRPGSMSIRSDIKTRVTPPPPDPRLNLNSFRLERASFKQRRLCGDHDANAYTRTPNNTRVPLT